MSQTSKKFAVISSLYRRSADRKYCLEALLLDPSYTREEQKSYFERTGEPILRWITIGVFKSYTAAKDAQHNLNSGVLKVQPDLMPPKLGEAVV